MINCILSFTLNLFPNPPSSGVTALIIKLFVFQLVQPSQPAPARPGKQWEKNRATFILRPLPVTRPGDRGGEDTCHLSATVLVQCVQLPLSLSMMEINIDPTEILIILSVRYWSLETWVLTSPYLTLTPTWYTAYNILREKNHSMARSLPSPPHPMVLKNLSSDTDWDFSLNKKEKSSNRFFSRIWITICPDDQGRGATLRTENNL